MFTSNRLGAGQRPVILGYLVAIASVVAAMAVLWLVGKAWHARPAVALFFVAVIISGWFGGTKPTVLAITLSVVALDYFFFPTTGSAFDEMHLLSFGALAAYVVWVTVTERKVPESLRQAHHVLVHHDIADDPSGTSVRVFGTVQDVPERKTVEAALQRTKANLQLILDRSPLPIAEVDLEGRITTWNKAAERVFGWTADEVLGRRCRTVPADQMEDYLQLIHRAMLGETFTGLVRPRQKKGGEVIYASVSLAAQTNERGEPVGITIIIEDITERKRTEESLRESEQLLALMLATLPVGVFVTDENGDVLLVNDASKRIWGADLIRSGSERWKSSKAYWHETGKRLEPSEWASVKALSQGQTSLNQLIDIETFNGQRKTIQNSAAPIRNATGNIVGAVIVNEDVSERVRAEDAVRKNQEQLRNVIDTIPVIAFISMPDGSNEFTNRSWQKYTGLSAKDTAGWGWESTLHPDDSARFLKKWRAAVSGGTTFDSAARYLGANGQYRWFLVRAVPLRDDTGTLLRWYGVLIDIEQRVHAEQALRESAARLHFLSRRLLKVQEEERRHLARELHDEFGQLLATITLRLHAAKTVAGEAARPVLEDCVSILQRAGDQVRSLALELRPAMLDMAGLEAALRWLASQHEERTGITTEVIGHLNEVPGDIAIAAFRVVQEALTNALRHAQAQHIWIEINETDASLQLTVRDDGSGFDVKQTLERTPEFGHLGLLGMKERIEILGGALEIDSAFGRGTSIRISLPLQDGAAYTPADPTT